ncbi:MAG: ribosomal RNA small subunit methyltransferase A [Candidatus Lokiarchaeota archaeon]|nr:ribosomal RNA small subunit methyltransferase A [Candidatus Lokiarchaeota archaeon]
MSDDPTPLEVLTPVEIRHVLGQLGQVPRKRHGQTFIHGWPAIRRVVDLCALGRGDRVVEVGPGLGAFTFNIARRVEHVHAIELDPRLADHLEARAKEHGLTNVTIQKGDALQVPFPTGYSTLFSAMPYSISAPLTFKVLDYMQRQPARALLMCQKEFGEKLAAKPGTMDYGRITANASLFSRAEVVMHVSRNNFYPVPGVDSVLVRFLPGAKLPREAALACLELTRGLFPFKNKLLRRAMALLVENEAGRPIKPGVLDAMPHKEKRVRELTAEDLQAIAGWYSSARPKGAQDAGRERRRR